MEHQPVQLKVRNRQSHKGTYGSAYLFAGSEGMMGAALLSARSCMRSGLGLLTVHTAACGYDIMQLGIPEAKCEPDQCKSFITDINVPDAITAVGIGPGIGQNIETAEALHSYLLREEKKANPHRLVIDADGLNILAKHPDWLNFLPEGTILTPHPGEWSRLRTALDSINISNNRKIVIVYKDAYTKVVETDLTTLTDYCSWTNTEHGHSGMAVGGSGDTLTGIILSLLAQGYSSFDAACLGVYIHSLAADIALEGQSEESWLPSDLIACIGKAFAEMKRNMD